MGHQAKEQPHRPEPREIKMGPFGLRTIIRTIQWSSMQGEEGLDSTSQHRNTNEE